MKNIFKMLVVTALITIPIMSLKAATTPASLKGRILLQVESKGEAWYVNPKDGAKYYLANGNEAFLVMKNLGVGISNKDLDKIKTDANFRKKFIGKILLQVESHGEAYYISFDGRYNYLKDGAAAYVVMRKLGLGASNKDLEKINVQSINNTATITKSQLSDLSKKMYDKLPLSSQDNDFIASISNLIKKDEIDIIKLNPSEVYLNFLNNLSDEQFAALPSEVLQGSTLSKSEYIKLFKNNDAIYPNTKVIKNKNGEYQTVVREKSEDLSVYLDKIYEITKQLSTVGLSEKWMKYSSVPNYFSMLSPRLIQSTNTYTPFILVSLSKENKNCTSGSSFASGIIKPDRTLFLVGVACYDKITNTISDITGYSWPAEFVLSSK